MIGAGGLAVSIVVYRGGSDTRLGGDSVAVSTWLQHKQGRGHFDDCGRGWRHGFSHRHGGGDTRRQHTVVQDGRGNVARRVDSTF